MTRYEKSSGCWDALTCASFKIFCSPAFIFGDLMQMRNGAVPPAAVIVAWTATATILGSFLVTPVGNPFTPSHPLGSHCQECSSPNTILVKSWLIVSAG